MINYAARRIEHPHINFPQFPIISFHKQKQKDMKKNYVKPQMVVVKLKHRANLLVNSANGNAFNGSINGYDGQGRASELDYIDDEW